MRHPSRGIDAGSGQIYWGWWPHRALARQFRVQLNPLKNHERGMQDTGRVGLVAIPKDPTIAACRDPIHPRRIRRAIPPRPDLPGRTQVSCAIPTGCRLSLVTRAHRYSAAPRGVTTLIRGPRWSSRDRRTDFRRHNHKDSRLSACDRDVRPWENGYDPKSRNRAGAGQ